jgi:hypothetical protein
VSTIKLDADTQLVVTRGREAWTSLRSDQSWEKWVVIGRAIEAGKTAVMRELGTNLPSGRRWNETFGGWLKETDFDQINKATRSHLQTCLDNLPAIEAWRQTIGLGLRLQLNHPYTVLRRWQASRPSAVAGTSQGNARAGLREENMRLKEELDAHKAKIRRLVADERGPQITRSDTPEDIVRVLQDWLPAAKRYKVASGLMNALKSTANRSSAAPRTLKARDAELRRAEAQEVMHGLREDGLVVIDKYPHDQPRDAGLVRKHADKSARRLTVEYCSVGQQRPVR